MFDLSKLSPDSPLLLSSVEKEIIAPDNLARFLCIISDILRCIVKRSSWKCSFLKKKKCSSSFAPQWTNGFVHSSLQHFFYPRSKFIWFLKPVKILKNSVFFQYIFYIAPAKFMIVFLIVFLHDQLLLTSLLIMKKWVFLLNRNSVQIMLHDILYAWLTFLVSNSILFLSNVKSAW